MLHGVSTEDSGMHIKRILAQLRRERLAIDQAISALEKIQRKPAASRCGKAKPPSESETTSRQGEDVDTQSDGGEKTLTVIEFPNTKRTG